MRRKRQARAIPSQSAACEAVRTMRRFLPSILLAAALLPPFSLADISEPSRSAPATADGAGSMCGPGEQALRAELSNLRERIASNGEALQDSRRAVDNARSVLESLRAVLEVGLRTVGHETASEASPAVQTNALSSQTGRIDRRYAPPRASQDLYAIAAERDTLRSQLFGVGAQRDRLGQELGMLQQEFARLRAHDEETTAQVNMLLQENAALRGRQAPYDGPQPTIAGPMTLPPGSAAAPPVWEPPPPYATLAAMAPAAGSRLDLARSAAAAVGKQFKMLYRQQGSDQDGPIAAELRQTQQQLVQQQSVVAQLMGASAVHTVRPDESLSSIARQAYGSTPRWTDIMRANQHLLDDPDRILPGMALVIP